MRLHGRAARPGHEQEVLTGAPLVDSAMGMVIQCWRDLEGERAIGFGVMGFLPWRAVIAWAAHNRLDRELTEMLIAVIHKLDADRAERAAAERALKGGGK